MVFKVQDIDESQAPLLDHLVELRTRLIRAILALVVAFAISLYFAKPILAFLVQPLADAGQDRLIFTQLYGQLFVELKVALFSGFFFSFPVIANQLWGFVAPGLYAKEKKAFLPFLVATPVLFILGGAMAYYMVLPVAIPWFLGFEGKAGDLTIDATPTSDNYLGLVMQFILAFGFCFLLPVLLLLLNLVGIVSRQQLANARRYVIVGIAIISAIITPPDVLSQLLLLIPMWLLFETSLLIMWLGERKKAQQPAEGAAVEGPEERQVPPA